MEECFICQGCEKERKRVAQTSWITTCYDFKSRNLTRTGHINTLCALKSVIICNTLHTSSNNSFRVLTKLYHKNCDSTSNQLRKWSPHLQQQSSTWSLSQCLIPDWDSWEPESSHMKTNFASTHPPNGPSTGQWFLRIWLLLLNMASNHVLSPKRHVPDNGNILTSLFFHHHRHQQKITCQ